ncbi:Glycosyltransferase involved in cell wall bisynthesis [Prevotella communis]|uniref:Glycosyltransferase involved in cell wall bisynthesis n=1 Tax=Prevotella communis TaxID=2913614 RepID=A0A1G7VSJ6_9BACT|nr:glycosyltransferase family 2 protein [Prevotella communis]SDG62744.1 Glycosyltransferase involved in cell wall bisynthesis [Prevotella communis]
MSNDLVSIIMPSYNCGRFVEETIRSVQAQTYQNWEIIFMDDCSKDDTIHKVSAMRDKDKRIHLYQNISNLGAAVSRNNALREARGRWIAFLDSDDLWEPEKLEHQIRFMEENGYSFSCTERDQINEESHPLNIYETGPDHIDKNGMFQYCWVGCLTVMYDANVVGLIQVADLKKNNDYAMWLKVIKKTDCHLLRECLAHYRVRKGSISHDSIYKLIKSHYDLFRIGERMNVLQSLFYTCQNLIFGMKKKLCYVKKNYIHE